MSRLNIKALQQSLERHEAYYYALRSAPDSHTKDILGVTNAIIVTQRGIIQFLEDTLAENIKLKGKQARTVVIDAATEEVGDD